MHTITSSLPALALWPMGDDVTSNPLALVVVVVVVLVAVAMIKQVYHWLEERWYQWTGMESHERQCLRIYRNRKAAENAAPPPTSNEPGPRTFPPRSWPPGSRE